MKFKPLNQLSEWKKIGVAFTVGTLFGMAVVRYIIPFLVRRLV